MLKNHRHCGVLFLALALPSSSALSLLGRIEALGRPALMKYLSGRPDIVSGLPPRIGSWIPAGTDNSAVVQAHFWRWLERPQLDCASVLVLPELPERDVGLLAELTALPTGGAEQLLVQLRPLPADAPVTGLVAVPYASPLPAASSGAASSAAAPEVALSRSRAWVSRTLTKQGLGFCPYTASSEVAGAGLESYGIEAAPIAYRSSDAVALPGLLAAFWAACADMLDTGEAGTSSIILSAPHWDDRWDEWYRVVFPLLEASVLASGLGRELGIVCFHPSYSTPSEGWLAKHRFGHMHATDKLRGYVEQQNPELSASADDELLTWAGSYQRRSPHAVINVVRPKWIEVRTSWRVPSSLPDVAACTRTCSVAVLCSLGEESLCLSNRAAAAVVAPARDGGEEAQVQCAVHSQHWQGARCRPRGARPHGCRREVCLSACVRYNRRGQVRSRKVRYVSSTRSAGQVTQSVCSERGPRRDGTRAPTLGPAGSTGSATVLYTVCETQDPSFQHIRNVPVRSPAAHMMFKV